VSAGKALDAELKFGRHAEARAMHNDALTRGFLDRLHERNCRDPEPEAEPVSASHAFTGFYLQQD
jgi:hypothetical protein